MKAPMSTPPLPAAEFADPRVLPDFEPTAWPLCNGLPAPPPETTDAHERRCLEFLAAYYSLNRWQRQLLAARALKAEDATLQRLLAGIGEATAALEKLEDRHAPVGFFGEPVMDDVFYRDVTFIRPELPRIYGQPASQSSYLAIPGLEELPVDELQGPVKVLRFCHGKMDL